MKADLSATKKHCKDNNTKKLNAFWDPEFSISIPVPRDKRVDKFNLSYFVDLY